MTKDDLIKYRIAFGLDQSEFAEYLGVSKSYISKLETGAIVISEKLAAKLKRKIESFLKDADSFAAKPSRYGKAGRISNQNATIQVRNLLAQAIDNVPSGHYSVFVVDGSSMHPTLFPEDKLICRMITIDEMVDNRVYVVVTNRPDMEEYRADGVWIKRCAHRKDGGYINCRSDNKDSSEPFVTFRLKPSEVNEIWVPILRITGNMADPNRDIFDRLDELEERIEMLESLNE